MSGFGTKPTSRDVFSLVAIGGRADMAVASGDFRKWPETDLRAVKPLSNRRL